MKDGSAWGCWHVFWYMHVWMCNYENDPSCPGLKIHEGFLDVSAAMVAVVVTTQRKWLGRKLKWFPPIHYRPFIGSPRTSLISLSRITPTNKSINIISYLLVICSGWLRPLWQMSWFAHCLLYILIQRIRLLQSDGVLVLSVSVLCCQSGAASLSRSWRYYIVAIINP